MPFTPDKVVSAVLSLYSSLSIKVQGKYTILAAFVLCNPSSNEIKILSLSTGSKCLPIARLPARGDALHDRHAEVLARRGAIRWFLEEIGRYSGPDSSSAWITDKNGQFALKKNVDIFLYVSTVPCGDASTRYLASQQDEEMALLKDSAEPLVSQNIDAARGRDNYSLYGVLRTKPGRADSLPTSCMSCSDKIAAWNVLGFQGALASRFFKPLYIANIIIGEVEDDMQDIVRGDCERAFWRRIEGLQGLPSGYAIHNPSIHFTGLSFHHSRIALAETATTSCNESLCWIADSLEPHEILINGLKRGVAPKHRLREKSRPLLCKASLFKLYRQTSVHLGLSIEPETATYREVKCSSTHYQTAKQALMAENRPFSGWKRTSSQSENFDSNGLLGRNLDQRLHTVSSSTAAPMSYKIGGFCL